MFTQTYRSRCLFSLAVALSIGTLLLGGCAKQRAGMALNSARKRTETAKTHEAAKYNEASLKEVEDLIAQSQDNLGQGANDQALLNARTAAEKAKDLLQTTKQKRATDLKEKSSANVRIASDNLGNQISPDLYQKITDNDEAAQQALSKSKFDKVIVLCLAVARDTDVLLQNLKDQSEKDLSTAKTRLEELRREGGAEKAPLAVSDVQAKIEEMTKLVETERQYRKAKLVFAEIDTSVAAGIEEARRNRAKEKMDNIERNIDRAIRKEEAEMFTAETLANCQDQLKALLQAYFEKKYVDALQIADRLEPMVANMIIETRILSSQAKIDTVKKQVRALEQNRVREYLPGRLESGMEAPLAKALEAFDQELYDETKEQCRIAMEEREVIAKEFDDLAAAQIREASTQLDQSDALLSRMSSIFDAQAATTADPLERRFEEGKEALKLTLDTIAHDARILLSKANVDREDQSFSNAIENAQQVAKRSTFVVREVFHVVAHNNVLELGRRISETEKDGGAQFAAQELQESKALVQEARAMIYGQEKTDSAGAGKNAEPDDYRPAVRKTSEAKAALESVIQRVTQAVIEKIDGASASVRKAEENKANVFPTSLPNLVTARQLMSQASERMKAGQMFDAAQRADQARQFADQANLRALQGWAEQELKATDDQMNKAVAANSPEYAAQSFKLSLDQFASAQELFKTASSQTDADQAASSFEKAKNLAIEARHNAVSAREELLTGAKEKIVVAKKFEGWKYDYPLLMNAIVNARNAIDAMERGDYALSRVFAEQAALLADQATIESKDAKYRERIQEVSVGLRKTAKEGAEYYAPQEIRDLVARLGDVRAGYTPERFETAASELDALENDLFNVAKSTPDVFAKMLENERNSYKGLVDRGAVDFAKDDLAEANRQLLLAESDFRNSQYRASYDELHQVSRILAGVEAKYAEIDFADRMREMFVGLDKEMENVQAFLNVSPAMMHTLIEQPESKNTTNAALAGADPVAFRQSMDKMYTQTIELAYPVTMEPEFHRLVEVFNLARQSGMAFEKMTILDQYDKDTAVQIVDQAHDLMKRAMKAKTDLSGELEKKGLQGKMADYRRLVGN